MTLYEEALRRDIVGNIYGALDLYEQVIHRANVPAPLDAYLNLACAYWQCLDFGFSTAYHLTDDLLGRADERHEAVLGEAEERFGYLPEFKFWRLYFRFTVLGDPPFVEECRALVAEPNCSLVPYFYLYSEPDGQQYWQQATELLDLCKPVTTFKNKYIVSVIESWAESTNVAAGNLHSMRPAPPG